MVDQNFLYQILQGTNELHNRRIIHRDLKPQNILIGDEMILKIADFGLSRAYTVPIRPYTHQVVTLWYRAPEVLLEASEYSTPIDVWSIACIFVEMVSKLPLFTGDSEIDQITRIFRILGTPTEKDWPSLKSCKKFQPMFPVYDKKPLKQVIPHLNIDDVGMDLLEVYSPADADL